MVKLRFVEPVSRVQFSLATQKEESAERQFSFWVAKPTFLCRRERIEARLSIFLSVLAPEKSNRGYCSSREQSL